MDNVERILLENIDKPASLFIFPTDVACSGWADHLLRLKGEGTVAMEKFIAWDTFTQNSIRSKIQKKQCIPRELRKIFASRIIKENAELTDQGKPPVFTSLIRPEWAGEAHSYSKWLSDLLPQLGVWLKKAAGLETSLLSAPNAAGLEAAFLSAPDAAGHTKDFDADDRDLYNLALRYAEFLNINGLFEPAWEKPPFDDTGKECFIFFPHCLSDYSEYKDLLELSGHVQAVYHTEIDQNREDDFFFYNNSRTEIKEAALYIQSLHEKENISWDSISVSITDTKEYELYVLREFSLRNIPFVKKSGKPLAEYHAGQFFSDMANCVSGNFSFSGMTNLLLNSHIPWKDSEVIQKLIDFGINNNCISSWVEKDGEKELAVNVWEDAFKKPFHGFDISIRQFFSDLKRQLVLLRSSSSFAEIRKNYFIFRDRFLDMEKCLNETDLILSRCISELMYLAELEKSFPEITVPDPFVFFIEHLGETNYLARQNNSGVVILPYRTAAPAPFDCHIVIGADQTGISTVFSRLDKLPKHKREKLGIKDEDASEIFINLHRANSFRKTAFFCAEHSFSGYAIPHSLLKNISRPMLSYMDDTEHGGKFCSDIFKIESDLFSLLNNKEGKPNKPDPQLWHDIQINGFNAWASRRKHDADVIYEEKFNNHLLNIIRSRTVSRSYTGAPQGSAGNEGKYSVSASSLEPYYRCSLIWLFDRVFSIEDNQIEADLMAENIAGLVYHAALNLFFSELKEKSHVLVPPVYSGDIPLLPELYRSLLSDCVDSVFNSFPRLPKNEKYMMSALTARLLGAEKDIFYSRLEKCLAVFLSYFAGCSVCGTETFYRCERDTYVLTGIVDCILDNGAIVDFKMNYLPKKDDCNGEGEKGLVNFQLPMYLTLAEEKEKKEINTALFFSIFEMKPQVLFGYINDVNKQVRIPKKDEDLILRDGDRFKAIMGDFSEKIKRFAAEIKNCQFSVFETVFENCTKCRYHRICRTVYRIDQADYSDLWRIVDGQ